MWTVYKNCLLFGLPKGGWVTYGFAELESEILERTYQTKILVSQGD